VKEEKAKLINTLWEDQTGSASVEAVVVLPFFILIFGGVFLMQGLIANQQLALVTARRCAWEYSNNGCTDKPPECAEPDSADGVDEDNDQVRGVVNKIKGVESTAGKSIPVLGSTIEELFGRAFTASARREVPKPPLFGSGKSIITGNYYLMCNEPYKDGKDIINGALKAFYPF
jgi:hypothetical protein